MATFRPEVPCETRRTPRPWLSWLIARRGRSRTDQLDPGDVTPDPGSMIPDIHPVTAKIFPARPGDRQGRVGRARNVISVQLPLIEQLVSACRLNRKRNGVAEIHLSALWLGHNADRGGGRGVITVNHKRPPLAKSCSVAEGRRYSFVGLTGASVEETPAGRVTSQALTVRTRCLWRFTPEKEKTSLMLIS